MTLRYPFLFFIIRIGYLPNSVPPTRRKATARARGEEIESMCVSDILPIGWHGIVFHNLITTTRIQSVGFGLGLPRETFKLHTNAFYLRRDSVIFRGL